MLRRNTRVILATDYPQVRHFLTKAVNGKPQAVIVGEAESAAKALTLARQLRPDIAIIDSCLPHNFGIDTMPLSRMGGLDAAQAISEEMPKTQVLLVTNTDAITDPENGLSLDLEALFPARKRVLPVAYGNGRQATAPHLLNFTSIGVTSVSPAESIGLSDAAIFFGSLALFAGLILIATMFLAIVGAPLALAGIAALLGGIIAKLLRSDPDASRRPYFKRAKRRK